MSSESEAASPGEIDTVDDRVDEISQSDDIEEDLNQFDLTNGSELDGRGRNELFEKGKAYQQKGNRELALKCFIGCIKGIKENSGFLYLPQCLRAIADTYYAMEDYSKAVQFIQAEKMYYETALVDTAELQSKIAESKANEDVKTTGKDGGDSESAEALKAIEYENLARLCLDKQQPMLALEYSAKAAKLRQQVYGESHPITQSSLDLFTTMYAEVGKQQYMETLRKIGDKAYTVPDAQHSEPSQGTDTLQQQSEATETTLRHRRAPPSGDKEDHTLDSSKQEDQVADEEQRKRNAERVLRDAEPYPMKFYLWLSPFIVIFAVACAVIFYDILLIVNEA